MTAVKDYDSTTNANVVDSSASSLPNGTTLMSVGAFKTLVSTAYDSGIGGVATFDGLTGANNLEWSVSYGSGKTLAVVPGFTGMQVNMADLATIAATPISGDGYYRLTGSNPNVLSFNNNPLSAFGFTILARSSTRTLESLVVTYHDGTTENVIAGGSVSIVANTATGVTNYLDSPSSGPDIFFGFQAPEGKAITSVAIDATTLNGGNLVIDDFGFIVSPIPEPSAAVLAMTGLVAAALRRRRND